MTQRNRREKRPTWTSLVLAVLTEADDFVLAHQVSEFLRNTRFEPEGGPNRNQVSAALCHLRKVRAADCLSSDGKLFWYATPAMDRRTVIVEQRTPEEPGTRRRGHKAPRNSF